MKLRLMVAAGMLLGVSQLCGFCGPSGPDPGEEQCSDIDATGDLALELGFGEGEQFIPLTADTTLYSRSGPQGGSHVFMTFRAAMPEESPTGDGWTIEVLIVNGNGETIGSSLRYEVESCCGSWTEIVEEPVFRTYVENNMGPFRVDIRLFAGGSANPESDPAVVERSYPVADVQ